MNAETTNHTTEAQPGAINEAPSSEPAANGSSDNASVNGGSGFSFQWDELDTRSPIDLRELIEAGTHFGHQTRRWNPKMSPFIFGSRNGIHIIDLDQTTQLFARAFRFVAETVARGGHVLFVGTKPQAAEIIAEEAARVGQFFVTGRWLGGTLTNFRTVKASIDKLRRLEEQEVDGTFDMLTKKEALNLTREKDKLNKYLGGIKSMSGIPSAIFVVDPNSEHIAVREGKKLHIPIVALTDTNCDPELVDLVIPGNDDSIRSVRLITSRIADACLLGAERHRSAANSGFTQNNAEAEGGAGVQVEFSRGRRSSSAVSSL